MVLDVWRLMHVCHFCRQHAQSDLKQVVAGVGYLTKTSSLMSGGCACMVLIDVVIFVDLCRAWPSGECMGTLFIALTSLFA